MKIAIVGDTGFIGSYLVRIFEKDNNIIRKFNSKDVLWKSNQTLKEEFIDCDLIIWASGYANPGSENSRIELFEIETIHLAKVIQKLNQSRPDKNQRFVFLSSAGCTYSGEKLPYQEGDQATGTNAYGRMKLIQEKLLASQIGNLAIVRLSNVYGTGQATGRGQGVIAEWFEAIKMNLNPMVFGSLSSFRDYIHIYDAVSAIEEVARSEITGIINVGSGVATKLVELMRIFNEVFGTELNFEIRDGRAVDRLGYYLSINRLTSLTDWRPQTKLRDGIINMYTDLIRPQS